MPNKHVPAIFAAALAAVASGLLFSGDVHGEPPKTPRALPSDGDREIVQKLAPICEKYHLPAIGAAIVTGHGLQAVGVVGVRKAGSDVPVTIKDQWHLASDTKAMTGALAGKLVEQGKLRWDMTVAEGLPEIAADFDPVAAKITLADLLTHRSGLVGNLDWASFSGQGTLHQQRLAAAKQGLSTKPKPGRPWLYSNLGFVIAGAMIEKATGLSWEEAIKKEFFDPLGMTSAGFGGMGTKGLIDQPWGHKGDGKPTSENGPDVDNPAVISPAGRVHCSLGDWAKFVADQLRGDRGKPALLKPDTYQALHTPRKGECYGKGWGVSGPGVTDEDQPRVLSHPGDNGMNASLVKIWPKQDFAILVCINEDSGRAGKAIAEVVTALVNEYDARHPANPIFPTKLGKWQRGLSVGRSDRQDVEMFLWFYEWNMFDAVRGGLHTAGTWDGPNTVSADGGTLTIARDMVELTAVRAADGAELTLKATNRSQRSWPEIAGIIPCFNPGKQEDAPDSAITPRTALLADLQKDHTYFLGPKGLAQLDSRAIHFNEKFRQLVDRAAAAGPLPFSEKWPTSDFNAAAGIIIRQSDDGKWVSGIAWDDFLSVQAHNPWHCMHLCVRVGPLKPSETKVVHGKIYLFRGTRQDCLDHFRRDFPTR